MINEDDTQQLSQEFMCHTNLEISSETHAKAFGGHITNHGMLKEHARYFVISQGQTEAAFPEGFGMPVESGTDVRVANQVLNMNPDTRVRLRYKNVLSLVRDAMAILYMYAADRRYRPPGTACGDG